MFYIIKMLYTTFLMPPGIFLACLFILAGWLQKSNRKAAGMLAGLTLLFYLLSTGIVSGYLIRTLESRYTPPQSINGDVIVMLGGGATLDTPNLSGTGHLAGYSANRLLTAAQLYYRYQLPIVLSGGKVLVTTGNEAEIAKNILISLGVPDGRIFIENQSLNTTQNAKFTKELLDQHGFDRPVLVTSAFHMERAIRQFTKQNQPVIPFPTDYQANVQYRHSLSQLLPMAEHLERSQLAIKEYLGLLVSDWY